MDVFSIRQYGDPVLRTTATEVSDISSDFANVCQRMSESMAQARGLGLAATQVGIQQRFFIYDSTAVATGIQIASTGPDHTSVLINPEIVASDGEWIYEEGCLSVPDLSWEIVRPKRLHVRGLDILGNAVEFEADELFARLIQHEIDHLDGVLLIDRLDDNQRKAARKTLWERFLSV